MPLCMKSRGDWFGGVPTVPPVTLQTPVNFVFLTYTNKPYRQGKRSPGPRPSEREIINELIYIKRGDLHKWSDIRYNFMIGPNGCVYECRGWTAAPTLPIRLQHVTLNSLYIAYIGDFAGLPPPKESFEARDELLKFGVENKFISTKFCLVTLPLPDTFTYPRESYIV